MNPRLEALAFEAWRQFWPDRDAKWIREEYQRGDVQREFVAGVKGCLIARGFDLENPHAEGAVAKAMLYLRAAIHRYGAGCSECPMASQTEEQRERTNFADPDEGEHTCAYLGRVVWGEDGACKEVALITEVLRLLGGE